MASSLDLDQVLYARAGWRKAILIPLWIFQVTVLLGLMGVFAYRLAETFEHYEEHDKLGEMPIVEVVWEATNVGFNLIALLLNILEIARKATERLTPFMMVCTHVIKLTLSFAVLALDIVAYLQRIDGHYSTIGLSLDCGLLAATLITFTYSLITYRRLLKYDDYAPTANPQHQHQPRGGFLPINNDLELNHTRGFSSGNGGFSNNNGQTTGITTTRTTELHYTPAYSDSDYPSQTQHLDRQGGLSATEPIPTSTTTTSTATFTTAHQHPHQATPSTAHPSPSNSVLKREVDRAISAEFGWGSPAPLPHGTSQPGHGHGQEGTGVVNRAGSVVVGGGRVGVPVPVVMGGASPGGVQRQHSWVTERGVVADHGGVDGDDRDGEGDGVVMGGVGLGVSGVGGAGGGGGKGGREREEDEEGLLPRK